VDSVLDAVTEETADTEIVFRYGDNFEAAPDIVRLWLVLDHIAHLANIRHPALTSLLQYQVMAAAELRHTVFKVVDGGLVRVDKDGDKSVAAVESVA